MDAEPEREDMTYEEQIRDHRWLATRQLIILRDKGRCRYCRSEERLEVHHVRYGDEPWDIAHAWLITLCETCHVLIHTRDSTFRYDFLFPEMKPEDIRAIREIAWKIGDRHDLASGKGWKRNLALVAIYIAGGAGATKKCRFKK
jgi:hypothetical protein